jgi:hypothetical protein
MRAVGFFCHLETILLQTGVGPYMRYKVLWQEGAPVDAPFDEGWEDVSGKTMWASWDCLSWRC